MLTKEQIEEACSQLFCAAGAAGCTVGQHFALLEEASGEGAPTQLQPTVLDLQNHHRDPGQVSTVYRGASSGGASTPTAGRARAWPFL